MHQKQSIRAPRLQPGGLLLFSAPELYARGLLTSELSVDFSRATNSRFPENTVRSEKNLFVKLNVITGHQATLGSTVDDRISDNFVMT